MEQFDISKINIGENHLIIGSKGSGKTTYAKKIINAISHKTKCISISNNSEYTNYCSENYDISKLDKLLYLYHYKRKGNLAIIVDIKQINHGHMYNFLCNFKYYSLTIILIHNCNSHVPTKYLQHFQYVHYFGTSQHPAFYEKIFNNFGPFESHQDFLEIRSRELMANKYIVFILKSKTYGDNNLYIYDNFGEILQNIITDNHICELLENSVKDNNLLEFISILNMVSKKYVIFDNFKLFRIACDHGSINIVKFIHDHIKIKFNKYTKIEKIFCDACGNGHFELVIFLFDNYKFENSTYNSAFHKSCQNNHLDIVKYLFGRVYIDYYDGNEIFDKKFSYKDAHVCLEHASRNGNFEMIKFIHDRYKKCYVHDFDNLLYFDENIFGNIFFNACRNNYMEIFKWCIDIFQYDPTEKNENNYTIIVYRKGFIYACRMGNFLIAEYLLTLHDFDYRTIHKAFRLACENGQMEIAQYLKYNFDIDHHCNKDYCYRKTKDPEILEWLNRECWNPARRIKAAN